MVLRDSTVQVGPTLRLWAVQDAGANVVGLVNGSGAVVERYSYDPFGKQTVFSPSYSVLSGSQFNWVYGFQGMRTDPVTGQSQTDTRNFNPGTGAWTSTDPLGLGPDQNDYRFEGNNSELSFDPSGEKAYTGGLPPWAGVYVALPAAATTFLASQALFAAGLTMLGCSPLLAVSVGQQLVHFVGQ
jgi:RHS repeat-associated protein